MQVAQLLLCIGTEWVLSLLPQFSIESRTEALPGRVAQQDAKTGAALPFGLLGPGVYPDEDVPSLYW